MPGFFSGHQKEYNLLEEVSVLEIYVYITALGILDATHILDQGTNIIDWLAELWRSDKFDNMSENFYSFRIKESVIMIITIVSKRKNGGEESGKTAYTDGSS
jgi:hypothetical protein